jgi:diguanylate cyclase (GGDEF)-like protein
MMPQHASSAAPSAFSDPLVSAGAAQREAEARLRGVTRSEWWLWAAEVSLVSAAIAAFVLLGFPALSHLPAGFIRVEPEQGVRALLALVLLFNVQIARRQWELRKTRRELTRQFTGDSGDPQAGEFFASLPLDPLTGLYGCGLAESSLAKEITLARRNNKPLAVLLLAVDDLSRLIQRHGAEFSDALLVEFARRLRRATRGSDFALRMGDDEFLVILPECCAKDVKHVLDRVGSLDLDWRGETLTVEYSTAWVDYQPGDSPAEIIHRGQQLLHLYKDVGSEGGSLTPSLR